MRHQDLTINHRLESWVFADAAARLATGAYVPGDIGRISFQTNTGDYWRLLSTTPTWKRIDGAYASHQTPQPSLLPAGTTSTTGVHCGLGAMGAVLTPTATGKVVFRIDGSMVNQIANKWPMAQARWGTGTPPVNGAAPVGNPIGAIGFLTGNTVNNGTPFSLGGVILNAVIGVPIWFDLVQSTTAGGTAVMNYCSVTATEIP